MTIKQEQNISHYFAPISKLNSTLQIEFWSPNLIALINLISSHILISRVGSTDFLPLGLIFVRLILTFNVNRLFLGKGPA